MKTVLLRAAVVVCVAGACIAAPPPELPGEEITEEYLERLIPRDSIEAHAPVSSPRSPSWLDEAMRTWLAPSIGEQIGEGDPFLAVGKGAVFVPRMTEATQEPDIEVYDSTGEVVTRGKPGNPLALMPGTYSVVFGSGPHRQQVVKRVAVDEGRTVPLIPDWSGLVVEVVNEKNEPFEGDYELVRIDEFEPYGRGRGADPDLGEQAATWILRPGIYKVLSVGEGYNTLRNFITVRLLPGVLTRVLLVIDEDDLKIVGGGIVDVLPEKEGKRHWTIGVDLGGSILFNAEIDRRNETDRGSNSSTIAALLNGWVRYDNEPWEWYTTLRFDEGLTVPDFDFERIENSVDDLRLRSLLVWRLLSWVGPYARLEAQSSAFAEYARRSDDENYFYVFGDDAANTIIDSSASFRVEAPLSPLSLETGLGANADVVDVRSFDLRFRIGFGYGFTSVREKLVTARVDEVDSVRYARDSAYIVQSQLLRDLGSAATHEAGPEAALIANLRLGNLALVRGEMRVFAPVAPELRFNRPDLDVEATVSWRLARAVTLDYELYYTLKQPKEENLRQDLVRHGIRLRFSLRSQ